MGNITQMWSVAGQGDNARGQKTAIRGLLQSVHQLATGLGWTAPSSVTAPSTWTDAEPLTAVSAWETWYDSISSPATLPPTSELSRTTPSARATWAQNLERATSQSAPRAVTAYLSVQNTLWQNAVVAFANHPLGVVAPNGIANGERAYQEWWFVRLGGSTGAMQPFPAPPTSTGNPQAPGRTPVAGGSWGSTLLKVGAALALAYAVLKGRRR